MHTSWWNWFKLAKSRRAPQGRRTRPRPGLEELESRLVPTVTTQVAGHFLVVTGDDTGNNITVDHSGTRTIVNNQFFDDSTFDSIFIDSGRGNDFVSILRTAKPVQVHGDAGDDTVKIGNPDGVREITANVTVDNTFGSTNLVIDDSGDAQPRFVTQDSLGLEFSVTGLAPATISYSGQDMRSVQIDGGNGDNTFNVLDTFTSLQAGIGAAFATKIDVGNGHDTFNVRGNTGDLVIDTGGSRSLVNVGDAFNTLDHLQAGLTINGRNSDILVINDQGSRTGHTYLPSDGQLERSGAGLIRFTNIPAASVEVHQGLVTGSEDNFSANEKYVAALYRDLLKRDADPAGLAGFTSLLDHGGTRQQVSQLLLGSQEYRARVVEDAYISLLHRHADAAGLNGFVGFLGAGGTIEQMEAMIAGSNEYQTLHAAGDDGFVTALYADVLERAPDAAGLAGFRSLVNGGTPGAQVASLFFSSEEFRADLVHHFYQQFLGRNESAAERAGFVGLLDQGVRDEAVAAVFTASDEYFGKVTV
jgi:hypothetical protein